MNNTIKYDDLVIFGEEQEEIIRLRAQINNWIKRRRSKTPLVFSYYAKDIIPRTNYPWEATGEKKYIVQVNLNPDRTIPDEKELASMPLDLMLDEFIFELFPYFASLNSRTLKIETSRGRHRSVFDIWRHAKYYITDITIYQVMEEMANKIFNKRYGMGYCGTIHRRVFHRWGSGYIWEGWDEFGMAMSDWKKINHLSKHLEGEKVNID